MASEQNKDLVRCATEAMNQHNYDVLDELPTPDLAAIMRAARTFSLRMSPCRRKA
jgi:hypothetical protein